MDFGYLRELNRCCLEMLKTFMAVIFLNSKITYFPEVISLLQYVVYLIHFILFRNKTTNNKAIYLLLF